MSRRQFLRTSVTEPERLAVKRQAAQEGLTDSAYMRAALARDIDRQSIAQIVAAMHAEMTRPGSDDGDGNGGAAVLAVAEPVLIELLQLVRLLGAGINPQAASRITATVNQQFPDRRIK
jgi:hypothetical protein